MAYTAERIKELFLQYSADEWAMHPVYLEGVGMVENLEDWFFERWRVILTNTKGAGASIMLDQIEICLKSTQKDMKRTCILSVSDTQYAFDKQYFAEKDKKDKKDIQVQE